MAPKAKKPASASAAAADKSRAGGDDEREEPLQAVILADPFETRFSPFTRERPRCLLPLANTPLIEYTLEYLANAGVEEVFLCCGAHRDQVEEYIERSKWSTPSSPFSKLQIIRSNSRSIGDAMRDLDKRGILTNDFLVVYGDVVSNLPLEAALAAHRARRQADKNAIMTMVLREAGTEHRSKAKGTCPVFLIDPTKDRCLHYEQMHAKQSQRYVNIDPDLLSSCQDLDLRTDLIDPGIDICTPDVLALWSDNFDFEAPRRGFLYSVLKDYELNGKTIHTHIIGEHYAARVRNLQSYDAVSRDIVSRWTYPLVPDSNLLRGQGYTLGKGNIYMENGVVLARSSIIKPRCVIGKGSSIGDGAIISNSIVGRRCIIGRNVKIDGAYIWDDVSIGDGTVIAKAIVANEANVGRKCTIEPGALISYGVAIADGITVQGTSRITRAKRKRGEDIPGWVKGDSDPKVVGDKGDGFEFVASDEEDDLVEGLASTGLVYNLSSLTISAESISTLNSDSDLDSDDHLAHHHDRSAGGSFVSIASDDSKLNQQAVDFHKEAATSIFDSLHKGHDAANIQLELTALRMSANASEHQVRRAVITAFMKRIAEVVDSDSVPIKQAAKQVLSPNKMLLERTMFDKDKSGKVDQVDFLLIMQQDLTRRRDGDIILMHASTELYNLDVIEPEGFEQWWADVKSSEEEDMSRVRGRMGQFMDVILASDSEESEGDDEEDDSEDE